MVATVTSLGRSGLHDWVIQRVSAVILAAYTLFLFFYVVANPGMGFMEWQALFHGQVFKIFTLFALVSLALHAWIGLWIVTTDYLKSTAVRLVVQLTIILACLAFIVWGIQILWSV